MNFLSFEGTGITVEGGSEFLLCVLLNEVSNPTGIRMIEMVTIQSRCFSNLDYLNLSTKLTIPLCQNERIFLCWDDFVVKADEM